MSFLQSSLHFFFFSPPFPLLLRLALPMIEMQAYQHQKRKCGVWIDCSRTPRAVPLKREAQGDFYWLDTFKIQPGRYVFFHLTSPSFNSQAPACLEDLTVPYYPTETLHSQDAVLLCGSQSLQKQNVRQSLQPFSSSPVELSFSVDSGGRHLLCV